MDIKRLDDNSMWYVRVNPRPSKQRKPKKGIKRQAVETSVTTTSAKQNGGYGGKAI
jgi:hypothetical protein